MEKKIAVSGCFDPIHSGHIELLKEASKLGRVIVILKGDKRTSRKKVEFMPAKDRKDVLMAIKYVSEVFVYDSDDKDHNDFSEALEFLKPDIYCAGADKLNSQDIPLVYPTCKKLGIKILYEVGGSKISSSSEILKDYVKRLSNTTK